MYTASIFLLYFFPFLSLPGNLMKQEEFPIVKIALIRQDGQEKMIEWSKSLLDSINTSYRYEFLDIRINEDRDEMKSVCSGLSKEQPILLLDITWYQNNNFCEEIDIPYLKIDTSIHPILEFLEAYLRIRNVEDVVIILEQAYLLDQFLFSWISHGNGGFKILIMELFDPATLNRIRDMKPIPTSYVVFSSTNSLEKFVKVALSANLFKLPERWVLLSTDGYGHNFNRSLLRNRAMNLLTVEVGVCCLLNPSPKNCSCDENVNIQKSMLHLVMQPLISNLDEILKDKREIANLHTTKRLKDLLNDIFSKEYIILQDSLIKMKIVGHVEIGNNISTEEVAIFRDNKLIIPENKTVKPIKPFYRVGITHALPWSFKTKDSKSGEMIWTGYCVEFISQISEMLNFDYELKEPKNGTFGKVINGVWNGVIGDLVSGETDLAVTATIMTADREEVVDFVSPYFEQTGISIVMRKPARKTSLFKFMTVLKLEVWLSIVAALVATACMVWLLDKYSPYSARNNKSAYPYPCREFTLKESFWFALTSFTPQGGGEAPKALSGRTLVAAYWLFVVLMLATFTANLAAFLTVERMQAPVQSLEQLARQSRIDYTVVKNSETHKYFINMKNAEDTLYRMWKELTLNVTTENSRYRVWDYPIKEQYGHILLAINDSNPVLSAEEGFKNVNDHIDADYAFIHDSSEIKYEISRNCNLTEVGDVFAEKPYAVAVQQGSHLQDEISKVILKLQRSRFFDGLQAKYWNHSSKGYCPSIDDNEGITLESLGGVFIATLFGLVLAMATLFGEVLYYRRKRKPTDIKRKIQKITVNQFSLTDHVVWGNAKLPSKKKSRNWK